MQSNITLQPHTEHFHAVINLYYWLAQLVRRQSAVREVSGSIPGRTSTQGLKIIEEKVLPLL